MLLTCRATVFSLRNSSRAIARLVSPQPRPGAAPRSRAVSRVRPPGQPGPRLRQPRRVGPRRRAARTGHPGPRRTPSAAESSSPSARQASPMRTRVARGVVGHVEFAPDPPAAAQQREGGSRLVPGEQHCRPVSVARPASRGASSAIAMAVSSSLPAAAAVTSPQRVSSRRSGEDPARSGQSAPARSSRRDRWTASGAARPWASRNSASPGSGSWPRIGLAVCRPRPGRTGRRAGAVPRAA